ncbi:MAG TPA: regulatory protein RecX [Bryobacteraceae bacterium]|jgi:regulatory protein|nr:regulatory protein RecX [Bryobacteraceae bacterium]
MAVRGRSNKLDAEALWNYALTVLAGRAHSTAELRRKLVRKAEVLSDVNATLARLREYGMLDDRKFSEAFASARLENQGHGKMRVLRDLRAKQVAPGVAQKAVEASFAQTDERALAEKYLERKYRGKNLAELLKEEKHFAAAFRRLRTAGFSAGTTFAVLKSHHAGADEFGEPDESEDGL